jgi:hypothetical protein
MTNNSFFGTLVPGILDPLFRGQLRLLSAVNGFSCYTGCTKIANSGTYFCDKPILPDLRQTGGYPWGKMFVFGRVRETKLRVRWGRAWVKGTEHRY